jgi:hypothetical protein
MSSIWISAKGTYVAGPQPQTLTESQKVQILTYSITTLDYHVSLNAQTLTESQKVQISAYAVTTLSYA